MIMPMIDQFLEPIAFSYQEYYYSDVSVVFVRRHYLEITYLNVVGLCSRGSLHVCNTQLKTSIEHTIRCFKSRVSSTWLRQQYKENLFYILVHSRYPPAQYAIKAKFPGKSDNRSLIPSVGSLKWIIVHVTVILMAETAMTEWRDEWCHEFEVQQSRFVNTLQTLAIGISDRCISYHLLPNRPWLYSKIRSLDLWWSTLIDRTKQKHLGRFHECTGEWEVKCHSSTEICKQAVIHYGDIMWRYQMVEGFREKCRFGMEIFGRLHTIVEGMKNSDNIITWDDEIFIPFRRFRLPQTKFIPSI